MNHLPNYTNTPPGGWKFTVPQTGKTIGPFTGYPQLKVNLDAYYHTIGYESPVKLFEAVEEQICAANPDYCGEVYQGSQFVKTMSNLGHTFHAAMQCIVTLISHRAGSGNPPTLEMQEARAKVCAQCPKNTEITPCSVCNNDTLRNYIKKIVGAKKTSVDAELKFCSVCHCANSAKIATKHEAIWKHMPERQRKALPVEGVENSPVTCWLVTEANATEAKYATS